jgi:hypothetical protein
MHPVISQAVAAKHSRDMHSRDMHTYAASRRRAAGARGARPGRRLLSFIRIPGAGYSPRTQRMLRPLHKPRAA